MISAHTGLNGIGSIEISGKAYSARYEIVGTDHVWLWSDNIDGTSPYAFRIYTDDSGALFDLSTVSIGEIAPASQRVICIQA